jgi:hypothetical protein
MPHARTHSVPIICHYAAISATNQQSFDPPHGHANAAANESPFVCAIAPTHEGAVPPTHEGAIAPNQLSNAGTARGHWIADVATNGLSYMWLHGCSLGCAYHVAIAVPDIHTYTGTAYPFGCAYAGAVSTSNLVADAVPFTEPVASAVTVAHCRQRRTYERPDVATYEKPDAATNESTNGGAHLGSKLRPNSRLAGANAPADDRANRRANSKPHATAARRDAYAHACADTRPHEQPHYFAISGAHCESNATATRIYLASHIAASSTAYTAAHTIAHGVANDIAIVGAHTASIEGSNECTNCTNDCTIARSNVQSYCKPFVGSDVTPVDWTYGIPFGITHTVAYTVAYTVAAVTFWCTNNKSDTIPDDLVHTATFCWTHTITFGRTHPRSDAGPDKYAYRVW